MTTTYHTTADSLLLAVRALPGHGYIYTYVPNVGYVRIVRSDLTDCILRQQRVCIVYEREMVLRTDKGATYLD